MGNSFNRNVYFSEQKIKIMLVVLFALQPILDILSFFVDNTRFGIVSTVTRMILLVILFTLTYLITDSRATYILLNILMVVFLILHMSGNLMSGYISIYSDITMYSRIYHFPLYIYFFFVSIRQINKNDRNNFIFKLLSMNLLIISGSIILSYVVNQPSYTYYAKEIGYYGIKGWFAVANSQSAIVSLLSCTSIAYAMFTFEKNTVLKLGLIIVSVGSLFLFGTKLSFYTIFLFYFALFIIMLLGEKLTVKTFIVIIVPFIVVFSLKDHSYANLNTKFTNTSIGEWQEIINDVDGKPIDKPTEGVVGESEKVLNDRNYYLAHKNEYSKIYNLYLDDLVSEFGLDKIAEKYNYSLDAYVLINNRDMKVNGSSLSFSEGNQLQKLFGMEQSGYIINGENYDVENDFHGIYFSYGHVGLTIFSALLVYVLFRGSLHYFFNRNKRFDVNLGVFLVCFVLVIGAAHYSGHVIKKPNVLFYVSLMISMILLNSKPVLTTIDNLRKGRD